MRFMARRLLLLVLVLAMAGTGAELLAIGHYESAVQRLPLFVIALAFSALVWRARSHSVAATRCFIVAMVAISLVGLAGLVFHYRGNLVFELEMHPTMHQLPLFWEAIRGATPVLAPAVMVYIGLSGLVYHILQTKQHNG